jgi:hypothetical protein
MISHPAELFLNVTFCIDILDSYILLDYIKKRKKMQSCASVSL